MTQLLTMECHGNEAVSWVTQILVHAGLQVTSSFDLRTARTVDTGCVCSYHNSAACDCDMVVLLVYGAESRPATVVAHSHTSRTWLSLVDVPGQRPSPALQRTIIQAIRHETPLAH